MESENRVLDLRGHKDGQLQLFDPGPPEFWRSIGNAEAGPLTLEGLQAAIKAVEKQVWEPDPCKLGQHVVSPAGKTSLEAGGRAMCHMCAQVIGPLY